MTDGEKMKFKDKLAAYNHNKKEHNFKKRFKDLIKVIDIKI